MTGQKYPSATNQVTCKRMPLWADAFMHSPCIGLTLSPVTSGSSDTNRRKPVPVQITRESRLKPYGLNCHLPSNFFDRLCVES